MTTRKTIVNILAPARLFAPADDKKAKELEDYLKLCVRHSVHINEAPFAANFMLAPALGDLNLQSQARGAAEVMASVADKTVVYLDHGLDKDIIKELQAAVAAGRKLELRSFKPVDSSVLDKLEVLGLKPTQYSRPPIPA